MVGFMWEPLVAAVKKEPETDLAASMLDTLAGEDTRKGRGGSARVNECIRAWRRERVEGGGSTSCGWVGEWLWRFAGAGVVDHVPLQPMCRSQLLQYDSVCCSLT